MTTPYTDDDVKAVQGTAICGPTQARRLLDAGYRKVAPEPEPLGMWEVVEGCVLRDAVEARRWDLGSGAFAERVARLLNIDEAAKAGGFKGLRHRAATAEHERDEARKRGDEFQAKFEEECRRGAVLFASRYKVLQRAVTAEAERDEARAEVERLTALVREVAAAGVATTNRKYVEVQVDVDTWADLRAEIGEPPADGHYPVGARPAAPSGERLRPHQFWVDGNLYNGDVIIKEWRAYQRAAERREPGNGVRPAAPTVTADMVREAWEVLLPRLVAGSYPDVADAFNRLLAEQGRRRMRYRLYGTPGAEEMYFALADAYEAQVEPYIDEPDLRPRQIEEWTVQDPRSFLVDAGTLVLVRTWEVTWDAGGNPLADGTPIYGPGADRGARDER